MSRALALGTALLAARVAAHGYIATFTLDGTEYEGFKFWNENPDPNAIGWSFTTQDEGPELDIGSPDFVCRQGAEPAENYGQVRAGGDVDVFWTSDDKEINPDGWAKSHQGPLLTYIAPCPNDDCGSVDKTELRWTKIQEAGLISGPASTEGTWATDEMRDNGGHSYATIPHSIADGKYVLRHEIVALHKASEGEPEFYMQCANIEVTNGGADDLADKGVVASELYSTEDQQFFGFSLYDGAGGDSYDIPGPEVYSDGGKSDETGEEAEAGDPVGDDEADPESDDQNKPDTPDGKVWCECGPGNSSGLRAPYRPTGRFARYY